MSAVSVVKGSAKSVGGCLIFRGSGVLVRVRRDPHGDDEWCLLNPVTSEITPPCHIPP